MQKKRKSKPKQRINKKYNFSQMHNTKQADTSAKIIFEDPILCSQLLKKYSGLSIFENIQPSDIENVTSRYTHMFLEERESDVVNKVHLPQFDSVDMGLDEPIPFFVISLIEHKSKIDYNVAMQVLRYCTYIWEEWATAAERNHPGISHTKSFRYPPILPIIYYEGTTPWTEQLSLHERVLHMDFFKEFIPDFHCKLIQLHDYSDKTLIEKNDELSLLFLISKLQNPEDFHRLSDELKDTDVNRIINNSPDYILTIMAKIVTALLLKINVSIEEAEQFAAQIEERNMGQLFENFKGYDIQEVRRKTREETTATVTAEVTATVTAEVTATVTAEVTASVTASVTAEVTEQDIKKEIQLLKSLNHSREVVLDSICNIHNLSVEQAEEKLRLYW